MSGCNGVVWSCQRGTRKRRLVARRIGAPGQQGCRNCEGHLGNTEEKSSHKTLPLFSDDDVVGRCDLVWADVTK